MLIYFREYYSMTSKIDSDSEPLYTGEPPSDMLPVAIAAVSSVPWKLLGGIFVAFMFLSSDVFLERILGKIDGAVGYGGVTTTKGTLIVGILLVVVTAIINALVSKKII